MANDKKFVVKNGLTTQNISFVDDISLTTNTIVVTMLDSDTLSFSGNSGQLFSITDSMSGTIFAVNDISGVPSIEVDDDGTIRFAEIFGNVLIGTSVDHGNKLQVNGTITATNIIISGSLSADGSIGSSGQTLRSDGTKAFWSTEVGYTGSRGLTGFTGSKGDQGVIGYTGSKGDQGVIGYTGSQGIQGLTGFTGSKGDQGVIGYTGSQGIQGVIGYTGSQGVQGVIGYTGSRGLTGFTGSKGDQGVIGYTGSQGIQGVIGYTGSKGDQGVIGYTGSKGDQGVIGYTGSKGDQGVIGYTGSKGDQGVIGYTGSQGIQGVIGYTGSQGIQGVIGYTGSQGIQGVIGYTGSKGDQGVIGYTGSQGIQGVIGYTGSKGPIAGTDTNIIFNFNGVSSGTNDLSWDYINNTLSVKNSIEFISPDGLNEINANIENGGMLSFVGNSGQLFSITDTFTGTIFSVNDISGIPSIEVEDSGIIRFAEFDGNVLIGTSTDNGNKLQVNGVISANTLTITGALSADGSVGSSGQTLRSDGTKAFWSTEVGYTGSRGLTGFTGSKGDQGVIGYTGSRGATGFTGSLGFTGSQGVIGFTGSQGISGASILGTNNTWTGINSFNLDVSVSGALNFIPTSGDVIEFGGSTFIKRLTSNGGARIGKDDCLILGAGEAVSALESNITHSDEVVAIGAENGVRFFSFPNNDTTWSNRKEMVYNLNGSLTVPTDVRAPVFYDSADANFYVDANSTSVLSALTVGGDNRTSFDHRLQRLNGGIRAVEHRFAASANSPWYLFGQNLVWTSERAGTVESTQAFRPYYEAYAPAVGYKEFGFVSTSTGNFTGSDLVPNFILKNDGTVGMGTTSPSAKLHIQQGSSGQSFTNINGLLIENNGNSSSYYVFQTATQGGGKSFSITNAGSIGVGTSSPTAKLHVSNSTASLDTVFISAQINGTGRGIVIDSNTRTSADAGVAALQIISRTNTPTLFATVGGDVGIGTTTPGYKLEVNGSFAATTKSFIIKHPTKTGKKLRYSSLESPYHGVRLTGKATISKNICRVDLPEYICGLCSEENAQVQLTNIQHGKILWVESIQIKDNYFEVAFNRDHLDINPYSFYWSFTAIRKDVDTLEVEIEDNDE